MIAIAASLKLKDTEEANGDVSWTKWGWFDPSQSVFSRSREVPAVMTPGIVVGKEGV